MDFRLRYFKFLCDSCRNNTVERAKYLVNDLNAQKIINSFNKPALKLSKETVF